MNKFIVKKEVSEVEEKPIEFELIEQRFGLRLEADGNGVIELYTKDGGEIYICTNRPMFKKIVYWDGETRVVHPIPQK